MLHVDVARRDADRSQSRRGYQYGVDRGTPASGVVQGRDQEDDPQRSDTDALENTQRTWIQPQLELRIKGIGQQCGTGAESGEIDQATILEHAKIVND
jgi:hypothetical protein